MEKDYREACRHCATAHAMFLKGDEGHKLDYRPETREWQHTFVEGDRWKVAFCTATKLRNENG